MEISKEMIGEIAKLKQSVADFEKLDNEIREYLYPIVYKMYEDKKLNKGRLPTYKIAIDAVEIIKFCLNEDKVSVHVSIHWRGDSCDGCDDEWVSV